MTDLAAILLRAFTKAKGAFERGVHDPLFDVQELPFTTEIRLMPEGPQTRPILMTVKFEWLDDASKSSYKKR